jgi:Ran GTPase-activating protein (RanGAP) involved in mRNA processing and transport
MSRVDRIAPIVRRNDPIINCVTISFSALADDVADEIFAAFNLNTFVSKVVLQGNNISILTCTRFFDLLLSNSKLTYLEISENCVCDAAIAHLSQVLLRLPPAREPITLVLRRNSFGPAAARALAAALETNAPVFWLDLRYNPSITDAGVADLALALARNTTLVGLDLIQCGCNAEGARALASALSVNSTLTGLLVQDALDVAAVAAIGDLLSSLSCRLTSLYLWGCELSDKVDVLCKALHNNESITTLALSYNRIDDNGAYCLSDMLRRNNTILKVHLGANRFTHTGAAFLSVALARNSSLHFLDLSRNQLRSVGVWPLAVSLEGNTTLTVLDLRHNLIDETAAEMLCELLAESAIATLRISGNQLGDAAVVGLAARMRAGIALRDLELDDVRMSDRGFAALCSALFENSVIERLSVSDNMIGEKGLAAITELLKRNTTLTALGMRHCGITSQGCKDIAEGLLHNATLAELDVSRNEITMEGARFLVDALLGNYSLMNLDCAENPFWNQDDAPEASAILQDCLERNTYYLHNLLMKDMTGLVNDDALR